jgi:long-chain acyl-CoA synthetase
LQRLLEDTAKTYPQKTAVRFVDKTLSFLDLDFLSIQFSKVLTGLGVAKGDRVAIYLSNSPQFVIAYFGALKAGATVTAISPLHREREVQFQLQDSGAQTVVVLDSLRGVVENVKEQTHLKHVISTSIASTDFSGVQSGSSSSLDLTIVPETDLAALQYTGGTTGTSKAAMLTHKNLTSNVHQFAAAINSKPDDVFLTALPLSHIYGLTTSMTVPIAVGATMVLLPKFDPKTAIEAIERYKVTVFCGVPSMYQMLLASPDLKEHDLSSVRVCISGAASLPPTVQTEFMVASGGFLAEGYGLSEASPVTHCSPVDRSLQLRVGSIGLPLVDTEAKIVDLETGNLTLKTGEVGELAVRGPQVMIGYWQRPDETAQVLRDGWLLTGDLAREDADGYFYIVDRKKDIIKHHGYSIYPRELENLLYEHPDVRQCVVVGKVDEKAGESPKAYVVLKAGAAASEGALLGFVNGRVAAYKALCGVEFLDALPFGVAGKVLRRVLRERLS